MIIIARQGSGATAQTIALEHARSVAQRVPRRLARWRLQLLDYLLDDLAEMRLEGDQTLPSDVSAMIAAFARAHDPTLLPGMVEAPPHDITIAQDQLFEAQDRIMLELAGLGTGLTWEEMEALDAQDEAAPRPENPLP